MHGESFETQRRLGLQLLRDLGVIK
jgi:hypothetical protein